MILITGAAGFIGSVLACSLNRQGRSDLILCDSFGTKEKWQNIVGLKFNCFIDKYNLFEFLKSDPLAQTITLIIHLGACSDTTETDVDFLMENNVSYSIRLCEWALERNIRFVYASSAAVYGDGSLGFCDSDELTPQLRPLNAYGFSKWMFDMWVLQHGLADKVAGLRFFNVFGPNEYHKGAMASVLLRAFPRAYREGRVRLFESHRSDVAHGEQARDFIYIDQVIDAIQFVCAKPKANGIFNVGTGYAHTFNELAQALLSALGKQPKIEYFPMPEDLRDRYQYHTKADMSRLNNAGYTSKKDRFKEYAQRYVTNYLAPGLLRYTQV